MTKNLNAENVFSLSGKRADFAKFKTEATYHGKPIGQGTTYLVIDDSTLYMYVEGEGNKAGTWEELKVQFVRNV